MKTIGFALLGLLGFFVLMAIIYSAMTPSVSEDNLPSAKMGIFYIDGEVMVTNRENFDFTNCTLSQYANDVYKVRNVDIPAGKSTKVYEPEAFTNDRTEILNTHRYQPKAVVVRCDTPIGRRGGAMSAPESRVKP
jgi:hypothetical protein